MQAKMRFLVLLFLVLGHFSFAQSAACFILMGTPSSNSASGNLPENKTGVANKEITGIRKSGDAIVAQKGSQAGVVQRNKTEQPGQNDKKMIAAQKNKRKSPVESTEQLRANLRKKTMQQTDEVCHPRSKKKELRAYCVDSTGPTKFCSGAGICSSSTMEDPCSIPAVFCVIPGFPFIAIGFLKSAQQLIQPNQNSYIVNSGSYVFGAPFYLDFQTCTRLGLPSASYIPSGPANAGSVSISGDDVVIIMPLMQ